MAGPGDGRRGKTRDRAAVRRRQARCWAGQRASWAKRLRNAACACNPPHTPASTVGSTSPKEPMPQAVCGNPLKRQFCRCRNPPKRCATPHAIWSRSTFRATNDETSHAHTHPPGLSRSRSGTTGEHRRRFQGARQPPRARRAPEAGGMPWQAAPIARPTRRPDLLTARHATRKDKPGLEKSGPEGSCHTPLPPATTALQVACAMSALGWSKPDQSKPILSVLLRVSFGMATNIRKNEAVLCMMGLCPQASTKHVRK